MSATSEQVEWYVYFHLLKEIVGPMDSEQEACHEAGGLGLVLGPYAKKKEKKKEKGRGSEMPAETPQTTEMIEHFFKELERPKGELTAWELEFVASVKDQFDRKGSLSAKQFTILERIYSERTA